MEEWKDIKGFEGLYKISNTGKVMSMRSEKIMRQTFCKDKYLKLKLCNGKQIVRQTHIIVAKAFCDNPHNKPEVNHIDGNKLNNNANNLQWVTHQENMKHALESGLIKLNKKPVIAKSIETREVIHFDSLCNASKALRIDRGSISDVCQGLAEKTKGYIFTFA